MKLLLVNGSGRQFELTDSDKAELRRRLTTLVASADDVRDALSILRTHIDLMPNRRPLRVLRNDIEDITHKVNRLLNNAEIGQIVLMLEPDSA